MTDIGPIDPQSPIFFDRRRWREAGLPLGAGLETFGAVARAYQVMVSDVEALLNPMSLGFTRYLSLAALAIAPDGALPLARLSELVLVHPSTMTMLIDQLEEQGFLERKRKPGDRRVTLAAITEEGRARALKASDALANLDFGVEPDEKGQLVEMLWAIHAASAQR